MSAREVDVVVLGAGPVGENAAQYAVAGSERSALLVDSGLFGGECSYYACMPSKAMLHPLDVAAAAAHLPGLREIPIDRDALLARRDAWVSHYDDSSQVAWARGAGLEVPRGHARLAGDRLVEIETPDGARERVRAREAVVVATGSEAVIPATFAHVEPWTSRDATGVVEVPERLAIVGGGVVACEAARWMAALGSHVTMCVRGGRLLDHAEEFAGELVADGLRAAGIDVRLGTGVAAATRDDARATGLGRVHGGPVTLTLDGPDEPAELVVDEVLVATGRRPALGDIGLDTIGLVAADLQGRTSGGPLPEWLYVVGDANRMAPLTHWGKYEARRVGAAIAARAQGRTPPPAPARGPVPQVVFTDPQVAWVGPTLAQARASGLDVRALDADYASAAGAALLRDDASGRARLVVDAGDRVVGATFVGPDVAELLHSATVAVVGGLTLDMLRDAVPSYPTASEIWLRLLEG